MYFLVSFIFFIAGLFKSGDTFLAFMIISGLFAIADSISTIADRMLRDKYKPSQN